MPVSSWFSVSMSLGGSRSVRLSLLLERIVRSITGVMILDCGVFLFFKSGTVADGFLWTVFFLPVGCEDSGPSSFWASGENCSSRLVEALKKFMMFLGLTPDDNPSPGMRLLAIATELVDQMKFYCNDSTIQPPTLWAKNMPLSREN